MKNIYKMKAKEVEELYGYFIPIWIKETFPKIKILYFSYTPTYEIATLDIMCEEEEAKKIKNYSFPHFIHFDIKRYNGGEEE